MKKPRIIPEAPVKLELVANASLKVLSGMKSPDVFGVLNVDRKQCPANQPGRYSGELLIVGTGRCLWSDVAGLPEFKAVMAVNDAGMYWPSWLRHWYSNDIEQLIHWSGARRKPLCKVFEYGWDLHSSAFRDGPDYADVHQWPLPSSGGSGVVSILLGLCLGYTTIVVAGMPFDDTGHFYDPPNAHNLKKDRYWSHFTSETPDELLRRYIPLFRGRVVALSGRLKEMLDG